jgi:hypothetical protein
MGNSEESGKVKHEEQRRMRKSEGLGTVKDGKQ